MSAVAPRSLFVVRPSLSVGGADRVTVTLLRHLDRSRFSPTLVLLASGGQLMPELPGDVEVVDLEAVNLLAGVLPLARLLRKRRPDIALSTSSGTNLTLALAAGRAHSGRPRIVLSERNGLVRDQPFYKRWILLAAKRWLYRRADCVTAVSAGVGQDLGRRLGLPPDHVRVVYNPIVTPELELDALAPVEEPWFDGPDPVLVAGGRLVHAKGFDRLLLAFASLRQSQACRLLILGEGPLRVELERQAAELGIAPDVRLAGFRPNPYPYLHRATAFVLSSRFEGLPGILIQAMACGTAVVAADCPFGPREILTQGKDGILVPHDDPAALVDAMTRVVSDADLRRRLGEAARSSARRFHLDAILPNYVNALDPMETGTS